MKHSNGKQELLAGTALLIGFAVWTVLIMEVDVQAVGPRGTSVGFAGLNTWFHRLTGVHMGIYTVTDWLGLVPIAVCLGFGILGIVQSIKRRNPFKADADLILLGIYYVLVIFAYLFFEMVPINYRPVLIEGRLEASYPSSTTLLVLTVMPTLVFQASRRLKRGRLQSLIVGLSIVFSVFMAAGRMISGVHWLSDIAGSLILSAGLYYTYKDTVLCVDQRHKGTSDGIS